MPVQGGYTLNHGIAYAGQLADLQASNTVTHLNKTSAAIPFGRFVADDGFDGMKLPATGEAIAGVTRRQLDHATPDSGAFAIQPDHDGGVVTLGSIWVEATEEFEAGDLVGVVVAAGADQGKAQVAANAAAAVPNTVVVGYDAERQLVQVSIRVGG